ncbi:MAG: hypothetical protein K9M57_10880, partial [Phycisphaerae bacterium]|nr:hypothetical protein [Phycisphaerae bacterium]
SLAHFQELARRTLYETSSLIWYVLYLAPFLVALLRLIVASLHFNSDTRLENTSLRLIQFGYIRETLCQAGTKKETPCSTPT